ncbi:hypothetical protein ACH4KN_17480 [Streptomyces sp. NPDC017546]|uniref:hypothetical protein n=1 Tax=Streptomyces sp. NPDC017546 TaxID=3365001 RepID=UPI0037A27C68
MTTERIERIERNERIDLARNRADGQLPAAFRKSALGCVGLPYPGGGRTAGGGRRVRACGSLPAEADEHRVVMAGPEGNGFRVAADAAPTRAGRRVAWAP